MPDEHGEAKQTVSGAEKGLLQTAKQGEWVARARKPQISQ